VKKISNIHFLLFFVFLSRILLLSKSPAFFDSPEYLSLATEPSALEALKKAHYPIHPLYIFASWLFFRIPLSVSSFYKLEFLSAISGTVLVWVIYLCLKEYFDKKKSLLISLAVSLLPYFWLSQINILYEPFLMLLQAFSFYFLIKYFKKENLLSILLSGVFLMLSLLVSTTSLFFLAFMFVFAVLEKKIMVFKLTLYFPFLFLCFFIYLFVMSLRGIPWQDFWKVFTSSNSLLGKIESERFMFFVRAIRNSLVVFIYHLTLPLSALSVVLLIKQGSKLKENFFAKNNTKRIGFFLVWLALFLIINSYWHAGMFGRISMMFTLFPFIILANHIFSKKRIYGFLLLSFLLVSSFFKVIPYCLTQVPYYEEKIFLGKTEKRTLVVSNYEEPYLCAESDCLVLNSPKTDKEILLRRIDDLLKENERVLMTSQAVSAPYNQYDGMHYHILSKRRVYPKTLGEEIAEKYRLKLIKQWPQKNLKVYQLKKPEETIRQ